MTNTEKDLPDLLIARRTSRGTIALEVLVCPPVSWRKHYETGALAIELRPGESDALRVSDIEPFVTIDGLSAEKALEKWRRERMGRPIAVEKV